LISEALSSITADGELGSLLAVCSKKDQTEFVARFHNTTQIEELRKSDKCKYIGRNMLGVRKFDDWIHALEIGNIMHLNPLTT
jgi:hypothetical protein